VNTNFTRKIKTNIPTLIMPAPKSIVQILTFRAIILTPSVLSTAVKPSARKNKVIYTTMKIKIDMEAFSAASLKVFEGGTTMVRMVKLLGWN
jgi:hypothetical protein